MTISQESLQEKPWNTVNNDTQSFHFWVYKLQMNYEEAQGASIPREVLSIHWKEGSKILIEM